MKLKDYQAIIFDLGGVILNIDYQKTALAFEQLGLTNFDEIYSQASQSGLFDRFETGRVSIQFFINELLNYLPSGTSANQVVAAWNAMILDFPAQNLLFLEKLKQEKHIFLLSNTNEIHIRQFNCELEKMGGAKSLHTYFHQVYFSNEIGRRKPDGSTFEFVCAENKLNPGETLFIDDSIQHIEGAKTIGLQTHYLQKGEKLTEIFS